MTRTSPSHILAIEAFRAGTGSDTEVARRIGVSRALISRWHAHYRQSDPTTVATDSSLTVAADSSLTVHIQWAPIIERAAEIVNSYDTGVTLRQLHYQLVSAGLVPNTKAAYKGLSKLAARGQRDGTFPDLISDSTIHRYQHFDGVDDALGDLLRYYQRDHTEGQDVAIYIAVEKAGLVEQLASWFSPLGIPIIALGGYADQPYIKTIQDDVAEDGREAILLYGGDFDPSGEDIYRDFVERTDCWSRVEHVALTEEQVVQFNLPPMLGKETDTRAAGFIAAHGELLQVEIDALSPADLRGLFQAAIDVEWDSDAYDAVMAEEAQDRGRLEAIVEAE